MYKKIVVIGLVVVLIVILAVSFGSGNRAQLIEEMEEQAQVQETMNVEGMIVTVEEDHFIMQEKELGEIRVNFGAESLFEGVIAADLSFGQYVFVDFDGKMTRSIPAQVYALKIGLYPVSGVVKAVGEGSITLSREEIGDEVIVFLSEGTATPNVGDSVTAYTNGAMTMSLPAKTHAIGVVVN